MKTSLEYSIKNKNIGVIGAGISGIAASILAKHLGAKVTLFDNNVNLKFDNKKDLNGMNIVLGEKHVNNNNIYKMIIVSPGIDCTKNKV